MKKVFAGGGPSREREKTKKSLTRWRRCAL